MNKTITLTIAALLLSAGSTQAQDGEAFQNVERLACSFPVVTTGGGWKTAANRPEANTGVQEFSFSIEAISRDRAVIFGDNGSIELTVLRGPNSLTFLETTSSGIVHVTVVYANQQSGAFPAVHSRHTDTLGDNVPSQQYGWCGVAGWIE